MSEIQGTVRDQDGLPIVGAKVLIRCEGSGTVTKSNTGSDGEFGVVGLPLRLYTITAGHDGFTNKVYEHLDMAMNRQIRLDITLAVGSIEQSITVGAAPPFTRNHFDVHPIHHTSRPGAVDAAQWTQLPDDYKRVYTRIYLALCYEQKQMYPEVLAEFQQVAAAFNDQEGIGIAHLYASLGKAEDARRVLGPGATSSGWSTRLVLYRGSLRAVG
jgi:hypothetical protein